MASVRAFKTEIEGDDASGGTDGAQTHIRRGGEGRRKGHRGDVSDAGAVDLAGRLKAGASPAT